jgi:putative ABC transport system ATP-binding protein
MTPWPPWTSSATSSISKSNAKMASNPSKREGGAEVRACEVSFGYHEPLFAKKNFTVSSGSRAAIVGPHGSGASSLLDILFGLRQPNEGHVSIDGLDLRSWYLEALA